MVARVSSSPVSTLRPTPTRRGRPPRRVFFFTPPVTSVRLAPFPPSPPEPAMSHRLNRRRFLAASSAALAAPMFVRARNSADKLNLAVIGVADRGGANLSGVSHERVAALCDVDDARLGAAK